MPFGGCIRLGGQERGTYMSDMLDIYIYENIHDHSRYRICCLDNRYVIGRKRPRGARYRLACLSGVYGRRYRKPDTCQEKLDTWADEHECRMVEAHSINPELLSECPEYCLK